MSAWGQVKYYDDSMAPATTSLTGNLWIQGQDASIVAGMPYRAYASSWQGTFTTGPPAVTKAQCYQTRIDGTAADGASNGRGSPFDLCYGDTSHDPDIIIVNDPYEPLVIDLNGDGIQTTGIDNMVWFDLDGNGVKDHLTWTNPNTQEGFLWVDLFGKNRVDNGSELFGIGTVMPNGSKAPDGFTALAMYDQASQGGNGDGVIDGRDAVWTKLRVWVDSNHDGVCDPGEVRPLAACNVDGISLSTVTVNTVDANGNQHGMRSECWRKNGNHREPLDIESITFRGTLH